MVGNRRLLTESGIALDPAADAILRDLDARGETSLIVAIDGEIAGVIGVHDAIRAEAHDVIHDLRHLKIKEVAILTGDRAPVARAVASRVHADTVEAELLPVDKASWIEQRRQAGRRVAMVGDGINDAPALAVADAGIALAGVGADLAAEAGDMIVMGDPLRVLPDLLLLARKTIAIIRQNIIGFAFGLNAVAMLSATFGILGPVAAAILHQFGSLLVLLNAMRLLVFGDWWELPPLRQMRTLGASISRLDERVDLAWAWERLWRRRQTVAACVVAFVLLGYATSGWTAIGPGEAGLLQRFGRYCGPLGPGLHLRWPYPIERVTTVARDRVRSLDIGFKAAAVAGSEPLRWESTHGRPLQDEDDASALLLTGDGRYVEMAATLQYSIDPTGPDSLRQFVFDVADGESALGPLAESAVREVVGRRPLLELLSTHRRDAETAAALLLAQRLAAYRIGVAVRGISFQDIHPPLEVVDAYRDVSRAISDRQRRINEANAYRDQVVAAATGKSRKLLNAAQAARSTRLALAASEADSFNSLCDARRYAPSLTDFRLFWTKLAQAMADKPKVILDDEPARRRHLIVPGVPLERVLPVLRDDRSRTNRLSIVKDRRGRNRFPSHTHGKARPMKNSLHWLIAAGVLLGLLATAFWSLVVADETEFAVVTTFGRIAAVYGDQPGEAGLHVKAPWQLALKIDKRVRVFEPAAREVITGDKRNLEVASYVVWRVADPVLFLRACGTHELAEARLYERVSASLSDAIGRRDVSALASTDAKMWALDELTREVTQAVASAASHELGAEVLDIRLRRFNHPVEVRPAVFELIRSERRQVAAKTRAEGEAQYVTITSQADRERDTILRKPRPKPSGSAEMPRPRRPACSTWPIARDPKFFEFLRTLESYRSILDGQATVVLSSSSPLLKLLSQGPPLERARGLRPSRLTSRRGPGSHEKVAGDSSDRGWCGSRTERRDRLVPGRSRRGDRGPSLGPARRAILGAWPALAAAAGNRSDRPRSFRHRAPGDDRFGGPWRV